MRRFFGFPVVMFFVYSLTLLSFFVVVMLEAQNAIEHRHDNKRIYVTIEIGRNLAVVDGDVQFVPVAIITWKYNQLVASINQFGVASATLDTGKKLKALDEKAAMKVLRSVESLKQTIDELEE